MRAERNAAAAVDADIRLTRYIEIDGVDGTGPRTFAAADAEILPDDDAPAFPLGVRPRGTGLRTGRRVAREADPCLESGRKPS